MYVNDNHFDSCMEKLFRAIKEVGKDLKSLVNTQDVLDEDDKLLDNQDLCLVFHVSKRTLQRYRSEGILPFIKRGQKIYYKKSDVREYANKYCNPWQKKAFENDTKAKGNN